ncbi:hypothetical protein V2J09_023133 [Rumex salicifolius]
MGLNEVVEQYVELRKTFYDQGFLDKEFSQLQQLQDESSPEFVKEVASCYFNDSERILNLLNVAVNEQNVDFKRIDIHVHQLKGSSSSMGAIRVKNACITVRGFCEIQDAQLCQAGLEEVKQEFYTIKEKIQKLLEMEKEIVAAGGQIPPYYG